MSTSGEWHYACDSYGKVQHSRKACVFSSVREPRGDRLVKIAAQIADWEDAKLISAAKDLLQAVRFFLGEDHSDCIPRGGCPVYKRGIEAATAALAKAEGRPA